MATLPSTIAEKFVTGQAIRALIVGIDGVIGSALHTHLLQRGHNAFGTTRRKAKVDSGRSMFLDLAALEAGTQRLPEVDVAIICAAMARFADCRMQPDLARRVNVTGPAALARHLVGRGTFVVRLSSSAVFDCLVPHVPADHSRAPRSAYGNLQAEAEETILGLGRDTSILRLTKIITTDFALFRNWIAALAKGDSIEAFEDHTLCPLPLAAAIDAATAVLDLRQGGIFQVSGASDISYADLACHLVHRLGLPVDRVIPVRAIDKGVPQNEVTPFTSMETTRLTALTGFVPPEPLPLFDDIFGGIISRLYESELSRV